MAMSNLRYSGGSLSPLEDDNLLSEILLRLPPLPSSLRRASLVNKIWRRIVADPGFLCRFREHHSSAPPLHGFYIGPRFVPTNKLLDPPDLIPAARFSLRPEEGCDAVHWIWMTVDQQEWQTAMLGCYRGLALAFVPRVGIQLLDPVSGRRRLIRVHAPACESSTLGAAVLVPPLAPSGDGSADDGRRAFRLVLVFRAKPAVGPWLLAATMYSSDYGFWENVGTLPNMPLSSFPGSPAGGTVVGDTTIYWMLRHPRDGVVELDLGRRKLSLAQLPPLAADVPDYDDEQHPISARCTLMSVEDGLLGFAILAGLDIQLWVREAEAADHSWVLRTTLQLASFLPPGCLTEVTIAGFSQETNSILLSTNAGVFMLQLSTMELNKVLDDNHQHATIHSYSSFF